MRYNKICSLIFIGLEWYYNKYINFNHHLSFSRVHSHYLSFPFSILFSKSSFFPLPPSFSLFTFSPYIYIYIWTIKDIGKGRKHPTWWTTTRKASWHCRAAARMNPQWLRQHVQNLCALKPDLFQHGEQRWAYNPPTSHEVVGSY